MLPVASFPIPHIMRWVRRKIEREKPADSCSAPPNKSLNRTRVSSFFIDNLSVPALIARRLIPALGG